MNLSRKYKLIVVLMLFLLPSCQAQTEINLPDIGIEQNNLNQELEIILLPSNTYKIDETIKLVVRLRSNIEIYTNYNFGVRMFILDETLNQWEEVYDPAISYPEGSGFLQDNFLNKFYIGSDNIILSTKDKGKLNQLGINLHPKTKNKNKHIKLLIVVGGYLYENETVTEQKVGAYTIVNLKP